MSFRTRFALYAILILATYLFEWPAVALMVLFFADINGEFRTHTAAPEDTHETF